MSSTTNNSGDDGEGPPAPAQSIWTRTPLIGRLVSPGTGTDPRTTTTTTSTSDSPTSGSAAPPKYNNFWRLAFFILLAVNISRRESIGTITTTCPSKQQQ